MPEVVCLSPPPVPQFGKRNDTGYVLQENYVSSWFKLSFINVSDVQPNHTHFRIFRKERNKLFQPWITYNKAEEKEEDIEFIAMSKDDHFNDVYEIMRNDTMANYTCPLGWVFQDSTNITHSAYCRNWTWVVDFKTIKPCIHKFHVVV